MTRIVELDFVEGRIIGRCAGKVEALFTWSVNDVSWDPSFVSAYVLHHPDYPEARLEIEDRSLIQKLRGSTKLAKKTDWSEKTLPRLVKISLGVVAIVIAIYYSLDPLARFIAHRTPLSVEQKLNLLNHLDSYLELCEVTPEQRQSADRLVKRLYPLASDTKTYPVSIHFSRRPEVNAMALPAGKIVFFKGLIDFVKTPEELAGVLAHEIEHTTQRHILQSVIRSTIVFAFVNFFTGDVSGFVLIDPTTLGQIISQQYSRSMESQADRLAGQRLIKANVSLDGFRSFFRRQREVRTPGALSFFSSHPTDKERVKMLDEMLSPERPTKEALSPEDFLIIKSICRHNI